VLLVAALGAAAHDLVALTTTQQFHGAAAVTPWIALGVMFQGVYVVGSIGLVITKRTTFYPLATGTAAAVSLLANAFLIPRFGLLGAAFANAIAYGTLAVLTVAFSWRVYPIQYEWSRLLRMTVAGLAAYFVASRIVPLSTPPLSGLFLRTALTAATYLVVLYFTGFFHAGEIRMLKEARQRAMQRRTSRLPLADTSQVEMAGEIVAGAPDPTRDEPAETDSPSTPGPVVNSGSQSPRR
jgi:O-antigen/teichoic acid export membrane protein